MFLVIFASNCRQLLLSCARSALVFIEPIQMDRCRTDRQTRNENAVCVSLFLSVCGDSASLLYKLFDSLITFAVIYSSLPHVFLSAGQWHTVLPLGPKVRIGFHTHTHTQTCVCGCVYVVCFPFATVQQLLKTSLKQD